MGSEMCIRDRILTDHDLLLYPTLSLIVHGFCKGFNTSTSLMLEVMRDIWQSRYLRSNVAHKQLARTSLNLIHDQINNLQKIGISAVSLSALKGDEEALKIV